MFTSYHVHSTLSDGRDTISQFVETAIGLGLDEIGISDHFVYPVPGRTIPWSMTLESLDAYFEQLINARETAGDKIKVRFGLECDWEPSTEGALAKLLEQYPLDYVIGSIHFVDDFPIDDRAEHWDRLSKDKLNQMMTRYWNRVTDLAKSGIFNFVGHIDVCKKFGHKPTVDLTNHIETALDSIAEAGIAVEINTSGLHVPAAEIYPSRDILSKCRSRNIPILVTADAHMVSNLTRDFEQAYQLAHEIGYTEVAVFDTRKMKLVPNTRLLR